MRCISYRQYVNGKTIESITMLSHSDFWIKIVQSEASTLPRHVSYCYRDSQVVINHLHNQMSHSKTL